MATGFEWDLGWDLGFGIWDLGFGIWDLGFGIWDLGFGIWDLGFGIWDLGFGIWDLRFTHAALHRTRNETDLLRARLGTRGRAPHGAAVGRGSDHAGLSTADHAKRDAVGLSGRFRQS